MQPPPEPTWRTNLVNLLGQFFRLGLLLAVLGAVFFFWGNVQSSLLVNRGNEAFNEGDFERAIELYSQVIVNDPEYMIAYVNRAAAYAMSQQYPQSLSDYNIVLTQQPDNAFALANRGLVHRSLGQPQQALADYSAAIAARPDLPNPYYYRALLHLESGNLIAARVDLEIYVTLETDPGLIQIAQSQLAAIAER